MDVWRKPMFILKSACLMDVAHNVFLRRYGRWNFNYRPNTTSLWLNHGNNMANHPIIFHATASAI
jgi:hypothetical protein